MPLEFGFAIYLIKEDDGEVTLLATTQTPSPAFLAAAPILALPPGLELPAGAIAVTLPLITVSKTAPGGNAVVYHTISHLPVNGKNAVVAYVTLGGVVVASATEKISGAISPDFSVTVKAAAIEELDDIAPNQTQLTLAQAGRIVQEAVPGPDVPFSTTLENAVGISPTRLGLFQEAVFSGVVDRGFKIKRTDIPKGASTKLADVRLTVQQKAEREV